MAVGNYQTTSGDEFPLAEQLTGPTWTALSVPVPAGTDVATLNAVSCTAAVACTAVGSSSADGPNLALAESLNGNAWSIDTVPDHAGATGSELLGVSCPSSTSCTAVGDYINTSEFDGNLTEALKGTTWSLQSSPSPAGVNESNLLGVSCTSAKACLAVGQYNNGHGLAVAEQWNGTKWTLVAAAPNGGTTASGLAGVVCTAAQACLAVGASGSQSLAESWNGATWTAQPTTSPGASANNLTGVSCPGASTAFCDAVGVSANGGDDDVVLAESWNGATWATQTTPLLYGGGQNALKAVSCSSATACTAVGYLLDTDGDYVPMAEQWDGTTWSVTYTPVPAGTLSSFLLGVSCTSATSCTAVGNSVNAGSHAHTLAEQWNGATWTIVATPNPPNTDNATLNALSCRTPTACTAVGSYNTTGPTLTLAETLSGSHWTIAGTPDPAGTTDSELTGISCVTTTSCQAVGDSTRKGMEVTLAESLVNGSWQVEQSPDPAKSQGSGLTGVSCSGPSACMGVGFYGSSSGTEVALAERWNGMTWNLKTPPVIAGTILTDLSGVSCPTAHDCIAVGFFDTDAGTEVPLAEQSTGSGWVQQTTPTLAGGDDGVLSGDSCAGAASCEADGIVSASGGDDQTLMEGFG